MSYLKKALKAAGMSQADLARALGVSDGAVNHWVTGKRSIPEDRVTQIEGLLATDLGHTVVDYDKLMEQARTPVGYAILWPVNPPFEEWPKGKYVPRSAEDFKARVRMWARHLSVTAADLEQVLLGNQLLPVADAMVIGEHAPIRNPIILAQQVGYEVDEAAALGQALDAIGDDAVQTFAEAFNRLGEAHRAYMEAPLHTLHTRAAQDLDNGVPIDDIQWWLEGKAAPDGFKAPKSGQELAGRFKSAAPEEAT